MNSNIAKQIYAAIGRKRRSLEKWCKNNNFNLISIKTDGISVYDNKIKEEKFVPFENIEF